MKESRISSRSVPPAKGGGMEIRMKESRLSSRSVPPAKGGGVVDSYKRRFVK